MTRATEDETGLHRLGESLRLQTDLFLLLSWKVDKVIVLGTNQEWNGGLVEASSLSVPFFDRVEGTLPSEIKHEEDGYCIVADKWEHIHEFPLSTKIPDGKGDFRVSYADCLLHEVDT